MSHSPTDTTRAATPLPLRNAAISSPYRRVTPEWLLYTTIALAT
jgi:hypothetical protein